MSDFRKWSVENEHLEFDFPLDKQDQVSFSEWLWRETRSKIRNLPEISYDEIPELLE